MNLLVDVLPTSVMIDDTEYPVNPDFRTFILFELLMEDDTFEEHEKIAMALELFYEEIPKDIDKAMEELLWFYRGGKEYSKKHTMNTEPMYSYEYDDEYIYSAFLQQYNIDLQNYEGYRNNQNNYLHWWRFLALFKGLTDQCEIVKIMGYRSADLSEMSIEQRKYYQKMKQVYKLPVSDRVKRHENELIQKLMMK